MRKEIGKVLRLELAKRVKNEYPMFRPHKIGVHPGYRAFTWRHSEDLWLYIVLAVHNSFDMFYLMIGWSELEQVPYSGAVSDKEVNEDLFDLGFALPDEIKSQAENTKPLTEFRLDLHDSLSNKTPWEQLGMTPEEYTKQVTKGLLSQETLTSLYAEYYKRDSIEDCINRINPCLDNAMEWLSMYGMPYLHDEVFKHTGIRIS